MKKTAGTVSWIHARIFSMGSIRRPGGWSDSLPEAIKKFRLQHDF